MFAYKLESVRVKDESFVYEGNTSFNDGSAVFAFAKSLQDLDVEKFLVLYTDGQNKLIGITSNMGTVNQCQVYPREIFKHALLCGATGFILVHNHPSNSLTFSEQDKEVSLRIKHGANVLGINFLDHIVMTSEGYISMQGQGLL